MFAVLIFIALTDPKPAEPPKTATAAEICERAYAYREQTIAAAEKALADVPTKNDWANLSAEAKERLLKPYRENLRDIKADKSLPVETLWPTNTKPGDVFTNRQLPRNEHRYDWRTDKVIDKNTVLAQSYVKRAKDKTAPVELIIIVGAKFPQKYSHPIPLPGMWHRIADLKFDGETRTRIAPWPHEAELQKLWPKYIAERETKPAPAAK